jgi:hypothetical protein
MKKVKGIFIAFILVLVIGLFVAPKESHADWSVSVGLGIGTGYGNVGFGNSGVYYGNGGYYGNTGYGTGSYGYGYPQYTNYPQRSSYPPGYGYATPYNAEYNTPYYRGFNPYAGGYPKYDYYENSYYGSNTGIYDGFY